jgi:uncharacterized membrane protein YfcA
MDISAFTNNGELGTLALGLVLSGVVGGLVAGMLGVGGGIVIVPILYHVLALLHVDESVRMHIATGTSLATIIPTSISSVTAHNKKGAVDWDLLRKWIVPLLAGVIVGSLLAGYARGQVLSFIFALVAIPVALQLAIVSEQRRLSDHLPTGVGGFALPFAISGLSTMMGIGGGTIGVPAMTLFGFPIHRAVATASAFGAVIAIPGTIGAMIAGWHAAGLPPYSLGYVNLLGFILIAPVSYFMAPFGAQIAHATDVKKLRLLFAAFIGLTAMRMLYDALNLHRF